MSATSRSFTYLALFLLITHSALAAAPSGTSPFIDKKDEQVFSPQCKATRQWIELAAGEGSAAGRKVNTWIRAQVTAGKKLKATDCPAEGDRESYEYNNQAEVTGLVGDLAGVSTYVYFPGGSGRVARDCVVFRVDSGERFRLKRYLKAAGSARLVKQFCAEAKKQTDSGADPAYFCSNAKKDSAVADGLFCLKADGIQVSVPHNGNYRLMAQEKLVKWKEAAEYFQFPAALDSLKTHAAE